MSSEVLDGHAASALARGIRNFPKSAVSAREAARGAPGSMDDPLWRRGFAMLGKHGFSCDIQAPWWHCDALAGLAADFPHTQIVIVHAGLPSDRSAEALASWRRALEFAARQPNVAIKVSGLGEPGKKWTYRIQRPRDPRLHFDLRARARDVRQQLSGRFHRRLVQDDL